MRMFLSYNNFRHHSENVHFCHYRAKQRQISAECDNEKNLPNSKLYIIVHIYRYISKSASDNGLIKTKIFRS